MNDFQYVFNKIDEEAKKQCSCGCKSCTDRNGINENTALSDETGELQICPFCKIASCADAWLDAEVEEMKENGTW